MQLLSGSPCQTCVRLSRREGTVISLVTPGEAFVVEKMAKKLQVNIPEVDVAGGDVKYCDRRTPMQS